MNIQIEPHTLNRSQKRGVSRDEIILTIENGTAIPAKHGRLAKSLVFSFCSIYKGKFYDQKRVEVFLCY